MHRLKPSVQFPKSVAYTYVTLARHFSTHRTHFDHVGPLASLLKSRSVVRFRGPDTVKFLQGLLTNDVQRFCESSGDMTSTLVAPNVPFMSASPMYALMLAPQGRFFYDLFLYRPARASEQLDSTGPGPGSDPGGPLELLADVDSTVLDELLERFNKYRLRADVVIENVAEEFSCWQRFSENLTERFSSAEEPEAASVGWGGAVDPAGTSSSRGNNHGWEWFKDPRLDSLGFRGIFPSNTTPPLVEGDKETDEENYLLWRLEKGVAEGSTEIPKGEAVPLEYNLAGLNAISFDKGCYVGQELIARTHHRGVIRKRLLPLKFLDDSGKGRKSKQMQYGNEYNRMANTQPQPQARSFSFTSSSVTHGGVNGAYYTSSTTRRTGSDGVTFEESKEADTTTRQASHRVARGIRNKGHSVTRKLNSDGQVDTMQTLHNINENELPGFEEAWQGNATKYLPGWNERLNGQDNIGHSSSGQSGRANRGGWALPSTERVMMSSSSHSQHPRTEADIGDRTGSSRGRARATTTRINID